MQKLKCLCMHLTCRMWESQQRRCKINAHNTRLKKLKKFYASKIAYRIRVCTFVIHKHNFAFPVIVYGDKRMTCVTAEGVENLHTHVCRFDYHQF